MTLDEMASLDESVAFMKCDIEGHELKYPAGAEFVIAIHHPACLNEIWGDPDRVGSRAADVFALPEASGFGGRLFDGPLLHRRRPRGRRFNYSFPTAADVSDLQDRARIFSHRVGARVWHDR
jgi:hypothetical protein